MFSFFANKLTESTGNLLDFSRGFDFSRSINSAKTGTLKYTNRETIIRSTILIMTAGGGYLSNYLNKQTTEPALSPMLAILLGSVTGLTLAHIPVVYGIIDKRKRMKEECKSLINDINQIAENFSISSNLIEAVTDSIVNFSLANEKNSNASLTLGRRNSFLAELRDALTKQEDRESAEAFLNCLMSDNKIESIFKKTITLESIVDATRKISFKNG